MRVSGLHPHRWALQKAEMLSTYLLWHRSTQPFRLHPKQTKKIVIGLSISDKLPLHVSSFHSKESDISAKSVASAV